LTEALILRTRTDLGQVESRFGRTAKDESVVGRKGHDVAGDVRARSNFERVGAAGEGDGVRARSAIRPMK